MKSWIGIDPGQTGAIARIDESGEVAVFDWPGDERALAGLVVMIDLEHEVEMAVIEQQQSMPKQGSASTFKLGVNYGMWLSAVAFANWPLTLVRPADWKCGMGYPKGADKEHSLTLARRLFPGAAGMLSRKKDHGRAEALLLAHYARKGGRL